MKALTIQDYGSPDFLEIREVNTPCPAASQVLIRIHAVSINDWDWGLIHGEPFVPNRFIAGLFKPGIIPGCDISGIVEAVGSAVTAFKPGDEVFGDLSGCGFGGFAEYVCAPQDAVRIKSAKMNHVQAASIPQAGMLALQSVMAGTELTSGQSVLINGAGGGVGSIAVQLLRGQGLKVTGVDSEAKLNALHAWGFNHVMDYRTEDFTCNGQRYDLIIDVKTDRQPADYERALNPHGVYATVGGKLSNLLKIALSDLRLVRARDKKLRVVTLETNRDLCHFNERFESGTFNPVIDSEFAFSDSDIRNAFHRFGASAHTGKIVIKIS